MRALSEGETESSDKVMAIYHCSIKIIGRSGGRSAVASSAYRSGEKLLDKETGLLHDYTKKHGVIHSEVQLCDNAPEEYINREVLWNEVQKVEKKSNSQLAREVEVALPSEMSPKEQIECVHIYVQNSFVSQGMCADWSLHDKGDGNPHAHIMLTTRPIKENGEWGAKEKKGYVLDKKGQRVPLIDETTGKQKTGKRNEKLWKRETIQANDWNSPLKAEVWRKAWADECNRYLLPEKQIDHRSYERQNKDKVPTIHEGVTARKMETRAKGSSDRVQFNSNVKDLNNKIGLLNSILKNYEDGKQKLKQDIQKKVSDINDRLAKYRRTIKSAGQTGQDNTGVADKSRDSSTELFNTADTDRKIDVTEQRIAEIKQQRERDKATERRADEDDREERQYHSFLTR